VKSVLVVDDDLQILGLVEHWLAKAGYDVVASSHFESARQYLASHRVDALITDLRLGEFNGLQLALRASQMEPKAAVVVMSAFDDVVSRRDAAAVGGHFILKPFDRETFLAALSEALAKALAV
jgi:DNA-binding NtrC family response regulator